jgi:hypothetical protein
VGHQAQGGEEGRCLAREVSQEQSQAQGAEEGRPPQRQAQGGEEDRPPQRQAQEGEEDRKREKARQRQRREPAAEEGRPPHRRAREAEEDRPPHRQAQEGEAGQREALQQACWSCQLRYSPLLLRHLGPAQRVPKQLLRLAPEQPQPLQVRFLERQEVEERV